MRPVCKLLAESLATIFVLPAVALYWLMGQMLGRQKAFQGWSQCFSMVPGLFGVYLRRAFYRMVFPQVAAGATISFGTVFSHPTCVIGRNVYVGVFCCLGDITLEDDVLIGSHVSIMNGNAQHGIERLDIPIREQPGHWPHISIGRDTWIGDRAVIMADVGCQCVIGAGSVVTKAIPDYAIAVGNPAKVVRMRTASDSFDQSQGRISELEVH